MYLAVGIIFATTVEKNIPIVFVLLPLLYILPAYTIAVDYWVCVRKASAYLVVFHESYKDCPIHWESRHNMLKEIGRHKKVNLKESVFYNITSQLAPYYVCAMTSILVYIVKLFVYGYGEMSSDDVSLSWHTIRIHSISIWCYIVFIVIVAFFTIIFFIRKSRGDSYVTFLKKFLCIKSLEKQTEMGKKWTMDKKGNNEKDDIIEFLIKKYTCDKNTKWHYNGGKNI